MIQTNLSGKNIHFVVLIIFLSLILVWKIIVSSVAGIYENKMLDSKAAIETSMAWTEKLPSVQFRASQVVIDNNSQENKEKFLVSSLIGNPADGRVLISLASTWLELGNKTKADKAAILASHLLPNDGYTQIQVASYWLKRNDPGRAISKWDIIFKASPGLKQKLFPMLLEWIEEGKIEKSLLMIVQDPPGWWDEFFSYTSQNASNIHSLNVLFDLRRKSPVSLSKTENNSYVTRLKNDELWSDAFLAWLNGLGTDGMKYLGQPYNGDFESKLTGSGFGWNNNAATGVVVETDYTYGNKSGKALHIIFQGINVKYKGLLQTMYLAPAKYNLTGRVRPDSIVTTGGLKWVVRCLSPQQKIIGESERFLGVSQWREFKIEFEVEDNDCIAQELRLESVIKKRDDANITGGIWFDSIYIKRTN